MHLIPQDEPLAESTFLIIDPLGKNVTDLPYAAFHYGINWIVSGIARCEKANGFIVQKVNIEAPDYLRSFRVKEYYEAWKVREGRIVYRSDIESSEKEDDSFIADNITAFESVNKTGKVVFKSKVYWINNCDSLYEHVNAWEFHAVTQAGADIRSSERCPELDTREPTCIRKDFVHTFNFTDINIIKNVALEFGRNYYKCSRRYERENFRAFYENDFNNAGLHDLFEEIIRTLDSEYS